MYARLMVVFIRITSNPLIAQVLDRLDDVMWALFN